MTRKWPYAPLWINVTIAIMNWLDRKIFSAVSSWLMWREEALLDRFCKCETCLKRKELSKERIL